MAPKAIPTTKRSEPLRGGVLSPSVAIRDEFATAILAMVRRMAEETKKEMLGVFENAAHDAMDARVIHGAVEGYSNVSSQARIALNALIGKYESLFAKLAKRATKRMVDRTSRNSAVTLAMSLREIAPRFTLDADKISPKLQDIITASTNEAVGLIKLIPTKYLGAVQGAVMRSIANGRGLEDLQPFLNKAYGQQVRHAKNVAMDQTRKVYSNITAGRMDAIGVKKYEWIHTAGGKEPRAAHVAMNGKIFSRDDPPIIGVMYGVEVRGKPGDMPSCHCLMRPIVSFDDSDD